MLVAPINDNRLQNVIYVYNKNSQLIARFGEERQGLNPNETLEGLSESGMRELVADPVVHIESNGESTLSFSLLANSRKWQTIKDPENIYFVNGRYYTAMTENAYEYTGEDTARIVNVTLVETWYLLKNKYIQAYNCGIYSQGTGNVSVNSSNNVEVNIRAVDCQNLGETITNINAYRQVREWERTDRDNNVLSYRLILPEDTKDDWVGAPQIVNIKSKRLDTTNNIYNDRVYFEIENPVQPVMNLAMPLEGETLGFSSSGNHLSSQTFYIQDYLYEFLQQKYGSDKLKIDKSTYSVILPSKIDKVSVTYTRTINESYQTNDKTANHYNRSTVTEEVEFTYSSLTGGIKFAKPAGYVNTKRQGETNSYPGYFDSTYIDNGTTFDSLLIEFKYPNMGAIKRNTTPKCTLAYGAEVVDEHTFIILPKADKKYKLTINGVQYEDSEVKDSRGMVMPRGSGGYAMWAALKNSGWTLGVCDVIAKGFDTSIDYGCFNVETDMKDVLTIIMDIQSLYGGILDWDSEHQVLNYRAENSESYQAYDDDFNKWKGYQFREGKNLTNQPVITYDNNIITKAYLLGYGNLNVKKVNNDKTYIEDYSYSNATYTGYLTQELIYDTNDEGGQKQLLYWGKKELAKYCRPRRKVSMQVTDIRTVKDHEHEVFDINDIVQAYYHDDQDNSEHIEELRVILWEYNVFAMWDCVVELGDKTQNEEEIFQLIYNKSLKTPNTNGSGQISSTNVYLSPSGGDTNINSIGGQLQLISQTTTDNSNAIAGLIIDTSANYSFAQLFAQYQKETSKALTKTYSGLQFYADEKMTYSILESKYYTKNYVTGEIAETRAALETYADEKMAQATLIAEGYWKDALGKITEAKADVLLEVSKEYAKAEMVAEYKNEFIKATAGFQALSDSNKAYAQQVASFESAVGTYESAVESYADEVSALNRMVSRLEDEMGNTISMADVYTAVTEELAAAGLVAEYRGEIQSYIEVSGDRYGGEIHMYGDVYIDSGKTFVYGDSDFYSNVGWTRIHTSDGDGAVLGFWGQGTINIPDGYISGGYALEENGWSIIYK